MLKEQTYPIAKDYIENYSMEPHIEGGFFKETYRSSKNFPVYKDGEKFKRFTICSYILSRGEKSVFHKLLVGDEIWSYQAGGRLVLHEISAKGIYKKILLGPNIHEGEVLNYVVVSGNWMAAELEDNEEFAVSSCIVVPGFEFTDWVAGNREDLIALCPEALGVVERLT